MNIFLLFIRPCVKKNTLFYIPLLIIFSPNLTCFKCKEKEILFIRKFNYHKYYYNEHDKNVSNSQDAKNIKIKYQIC